jgi:hypothetical protein
MNRSSVNLILAGSLATTLAALVVPASAQDTTKEKCLELHSMPWRCTLRRDKFYPADDRILGSSCR